MVEGSDDWSRLVLSQHLKHMRRAIQTNQTRKTIGKHKEHRHKMLITPDKQKTIQPTNKQTPKPNKMPFQLFPNEVFSFLTASELSAAARLSVALRRMAEQEAEPPERCGMLVVVWAWFCVSGDSGDLLSLWPKDLKG